MEGQGGGKAQGVADQKTKTIFAYIHSVRPCILEKAT
jgi:hypothetical protein